MPSIKKSATENSTNLFIQHSSVVDHQNMQNDSLSLIRYQDDFLSVAHLLPNNSAKLTKERRAFLSGEFPDPSFSISVASSKNRAEKIDERKNLYQSVLATREKFLRQIRFLKAKGIEIKPNKEITLIHTLMLGMVGPLKKFFDQIKYKSSKILENEGKSIEVSFVTKTFYEENGKLHIVLWNWFQDSPFFEASVSLSEIERVNAKKFLDKKADQALKKHLRKFRFKKAIKILSSLNPEQIKKIRSQVVFDEASEPLTPDKISKSHTSWKALLNDFDVSLTSRIPGAPVDLDESKNHTSIHFTKEYSRPLFRGGEFSVIHLEDVSSFELTLRNPAAERKFSKINDEKWKLPKNYIDKYGNYVGVEWGRTRGNIYLERIIVYPPLPFAKSFGEEYYQKINGLDLSPIGMEDYPLLYSLKLQKAIEYPSKTSPYTIHSDLMDEEEKVKEVSPMVSNALKKIEILFGYKPGSKIKMVNFIPANYAENAHVSNVHPNFIEFYDEILPFIKSPNGDSVVSHEGLHCIDNQMGFSERGPLPSLYRAIRRSNDPSFFAMLDEASFFGTSGGHSKDSMSEFFATLVNGLTSPLWEEKVGEMSHKYRALYYYCLKYLQIGLKQKDPSILNAPIDKVISAKMDYLEKLNANPYPPLEEILEEGSFEKTFLGKGVGFP